MKTTWDTSAWDDEYEWPFTSAADDSPDALYRLWAVDGRVGEDPPPGWRPRS
jgi:hypothetical protein